MSKFRPPPRVKSVRRHHMDLVEEHRILNGHYKRLMSAKSVIDTSTPRSFYTNPRKKRQQMQNGNQNRSPSPFRSLSRSRSAGSVIKGESFRPSPEGGTYRNYSPPVKIVVSPSLDSTLQRSVSRIDLHRASSLNPSPAARRAGSLGNLNSTNLSAFRTKRASTVSSRNESPYFARKRSISRQYERRHIDGDIADRHFHYFNQPREPFQPRLLLFNLAESKVAQQPKHYQPPFWKLRSQHMRAARLGLAGPNGPFGVDGPGAQDQLGLSFNNAHGDEELLSPPEKYAQSSPSVTFRLGRGRISPNTLCHLSPTMARTLLFERVYQYNEQDEWRFMKEVTRDIIAAQTCSERVLFHIFSQAIKRWRNTLPVPRMRILLTRLMDDIQAPKTGILSVYVEHESPVFHRTKDAATLTGHSDDEDDAAKYDEDEYEQDEDEEVAIESLADEDMENILQGKNLDELYERLEERERKQKGQKKPRTPKKTVIETRRTKDTMDEIEEVPSVKSESSKTVSSKNQRQASAESVSEASSKTKQLSTASSRSSKKKPKAKSGDLPESDEDTVGQVSDIEEEELQKRVSSILSNGKSERGSRGSSTSKREEQKSEKEKNAVKSLSSSLSSADFRLDATPPKVFNSDDSNLPSARRSGNRTPQSPPSREQSLKSVKSDHENSAMPTSKQNRKQWSSKKEMSITKLESPPTLKSEQPEEVPVVQPRTSISSLIAEEVRQKRESFLKKLEENERRISQNGSMNGENLLASVSSTRSASRRSSFGKREELPQKITTGSKTESVDAQLEDEGTKDTEHAKMAGPLPEDEHSSVAPEPPKPKPRRSLSRSSLGMVTPAGLVQPTRSASRMSSRQNSIGGIGSDSQAASRQTSVQRASIDADDREAEKPPEYQGIQTIEEGRPEATISSHTVEEGTPKEIENGKPNGIVLGDLSHGTEASRQPSPRADPHRPSEQVNQEDVQHTDKDEPPVTASPSPREPILS